MVACTTVVFAVVDAIGAGGVCVVAGVVIVGDGFTYVVITAGVEGVMWGGDVVCDGVVVGLVADVVDIVVVTDVVVVGVDVVDVRSSARVGSVGWS